MLNDQMHADDIVQDVFIKLYQNLDSIHNRQSIQFWLFKTTRNEILALFRNRGNKQLYYNALDVEEVEIESPQSISEELENKEMNKLIFAELNNMSDDFREVFVLREYSGLSYKEVASLLEIDEDLVKSRLYKARQKLVNSISKLIK
jgi:RNA polymerase sigma-70 factor (ECF subfamily)